MMACPTLLYFRWWGSRTSNQVRGTDHRWNNQRLIECWLVSINDDAFLHGMHARYGALGRGILLDIACRDFKSKSFKCPIARLCSIYVLSHTPYSSRGKNPNTHSY